jgi:hypothetical protein
MVTQQTHFLTESQCKYLIEFYKSYFPQYGIKFCEGYNHLINLWNLKDKFEFVNELHDRLVEHIKPIYNDDVTVDYFEICERFPNTAMDFHKDYNHQKYTSIIYLNDDFEGGETMIENISIKAEMGKIVTFEGSKLMHGINEIKKASRFSMPIWYK